MNMETNKNAVTKNFVPKRGKKLNAGFLSIRDDKTVGGTAEGFFVCLKPLTDTEGKVRLGNFDQELWVMDLRTVDGELKTYWADAGLRGAMKMAKVQEEQYIFITHTGKKEIEQGTVQTYEIFGSEN